MPSVKMVVIKGELNYVEMFTMHGREEVLINDCFYHNSFHNVE